MSSPAKWTACDWIPNGRGRKTVAWRSDAFPGIIIRHCGHPTALRPYYLCGVDTARKFMQLQQAQAAVAMVAAGEIEAEDVATYDFPLKHRGFY